jgi:hypothetical protein
MSVGPAPLRVYLDEDVDVLLGPLLAVHNSDTQTAAGQGHLAWSDEAHLEYAAGESRVLVTHNRVDFENLAVAWWSRQEEHAGIVLAVRRASTYDLARRLLQVLSRYDQAAWRNIVLYA